LFRKFAVDFAERYKTTPVQLDEDARQALTAYSWPGNVRELKNIAEQVSVLSTEKQLTAATLRPFLPEQQNNRLPMLVSNANGHTQNDFANERELLYKLFFDMKKDVTELKKMFVDILQNPQDAAAAAAYTKESLLRDYPASVELQPAVTAPALYHQPQAAVLMPHDDIQEHEEVEESLNIMDKEKELILKALRKHKGKRKDAAADLGISERTLYRKLKEYDIND
ncbi:MAG: helix-turn-helix domain-containing protein, partial [Flavihumibacter sp.]